MPGAPLTTSLAQNAGNHPSVCVDVDVDVAANRQVASPSAKLEGSGAANCGSQDQRGVISDDSRHFLARVGCNRWIVWLRSNTHLKPPIFSSTTRPTLLQTPRRGLL